MTWKLIHRVLRTLFCNLDHLKFHQFQAKRPNYIHRRGCRNLNASKFFLLLLFAADPCFGGGSSDSWIQLHACLVLPPVNKEMEYSITRSYDQSLLDYYEFISIRQGRHDQWTCTPNCSRGDPYKSATSTSREEACKHHYYIQNPIQ